MLGGEVEAVFLGGLHHHRHAAGHFDQLIVAHPVGGGEDDLVAGVEQGLQSAVEDGLAAAGDHDFVGAVVQAPVLLEPLGHGLAHVQGAGGGGVFGLIVFNGPDTGLLDVFRGGEVGFADAEADYVDAFRAHLLELSVDCHGGGCPNRLGLLGKCFHNSRPPNEDFFCQFISR